MRYDAAKERWMIFCHEFCHEKKPVYTDFLGIGVTRFELAASTSLR